jgi:hypothetical protein
MIRFWVLVICWSHCVLTQSLEPGQHSALMSVYDSLGVWRMLTSSLSVYVRFSQRWLTFLFSQVAAMQQRARDSMCRQFVLARV